jgi:hypothetical protein
MSTEIRNELVTIVVRDRDTTDLHNPAARFAVEPSRVSDGWSVFEMLFRTSYGSSGRIAATCENWN